MNDGNNKIMYLSKDKTYSQVYMEYLLPKLTKY